ncbi:DinB family protein [Nocardia gipuzkoensis]|uniref:DinB family protein n=1 Tax=Nocardia gipuzkoensis TaxID=2749991 RepID=UPI003EE09B7C
MTTSIIDRRDISAELQRARRTLHHLVASADRGALGRRSDGTRWTNEQLLFHMVFGFMVVRRLLPLMRLFGHLPPWVGRAFVRVLDVGTMPFHVINYMGSRGAALVYNRRRVTDKCDQVIAALQRTLATEPEANFGLSMPFPTRWDPLFTDRMTLEDLYRYPVRHFDFHARQLTLDPAPPGG